MHLDTKEFGVIKVNTPKEFLAKQEKNLLYEKFCGIRAMGLKI